MRLALPRRGRSWATAAPSLVVLGLAVGLTSCRRQEPPPVPPPAAVTVSRPLERDVVEWHEYTGRLSAVEEVEVRARVSGFIDSASFAEGLPVSRGQLLFVIDPRPFQAELDRAKADVLRAEAKVQNTKSELARIEGL